MLILMAWIFELGFGRVRAFGLLHVSPASDDRELRRVAGISTKRRRVASRSERGKGMPRRASCREEGAVRQMKRERFGGGERESERERDG